MLTQAKLTTQAIKLAKQCKNGKCSLGSALLTIQSQAKQTAMEVTPTHITACDWLSAYVTIRNKANETFWTQYRAVAC